jgi:D-glycero-D-manno-heptose 1,7-bisphosphate phosphatase
VSDHLLRPAVFLDRDGTISEEIGYLNHISRFHMFPFAPAAIRKLNERGLLVFVITNQSGVARGYYPESLVHDVHDLMRSFVVGDRHSDVELAHRVGARSIMVRTGYGEGEILWHAQGWDIMPDFIAANLTSAVDWILEQTS